MVRLNLFQNRGIICFIAIIFIPLFNFAQNYNSVKLEKSIFFTQDDGLPDNSIRSITETADGFIWLGTGKGLCRFDGTQFKTFTYDPTDSTSIYDDRILPLLPDGQYLWLGTHLGLSIFDLKTEKFKNYQFENQQLRDTLSKKVSTRVMSLLKSKDGSIWAGTYWDGIFRYLPEQDSFKNYSFPSEKVAQHFPSAKNIDHILSLTQDRFNDSIIWAGTSAGLLQINTITDSIQWHLYPKKTEKSFIHQNAFRNIYHHDNGLLYLSSWHAKVNVFDPKTKRFYPLPIKNNSLKEQEEAHHFLSTPVSPIIRKSKDELWIQSLKGLMTYNINSHKWTRIQRTKLHKNIYYGVRFVDSKGRAWLPRGDGLHFFDPLQQQFIQYEYDDLNPDNYGFTYYFLGQKGKNEFGVLPRDADGIYFLNTQTDEWKEFPVDKKYLEISGAFGPRGASLAPSGEWTIISVSALYTFDPELKSFKPIPLPAHFRQKSFRSILWDSSERLWIGTANSGILRWTPEQNKWEVIKEELERGEIKSSSIGISDLLEDRRGNIWIRKQGGFCVYDSKRDTFFNFSANSNLENTFDYVRNFNEDQQGRVWVNGAHAQIGYAEIDSFEKGIVQKFDFMSSHQLPHISYLRIDAKGMLWGITDDQLIQINTNTFELSQHSIKYGVTTIHDDIYGFDILPDGRFVIGGRNKVWVADPENFQSNNEKPKPYLTGISILQNPLKVDTPIHLISKLDLAYAENFFSFDFSSIGFTRGPENKFQHRLKGFDDKWTESSSRRFANFTNVPPGDYVFELKAANNEEIWNEEAYSLAISIATPWWETIWFWTLAAIGLAGLIYLFYKWRIEQVRKEERLRSEYERKLTIIEMSALRAQMNPHFIFNSLNSIEYFIISNEPEKAADYLNRFSRLIRLILQNSKSTVVPLKDDLEALRLYIEIESMRFDNIFDYEVRLEKGLDVERLQIPPMILQPYIENAIWHGLMQKKDAPGRIDLVINQNESSLSCIIEDNGIGRKVAQELKSKSGSRRKSFGMKITKERLDALNQLTQSKASVQIFDLQNDDGTAKGTRVELVIPL